MWRPIFPPALEKRIEVRKRAILYAEHITFWQLQISGGTISTISEENWKEEVKRIESHILTNEGLDRIASFRLNLWQPQGVVFTEVRTGVEVLGVWPDDTLNGRRV